MNLLRSLLLAVVATTSLACSSEVGEDSSTVDEALTAPVLPAGLYRNLDPAVKSTTSIVYFAITLAANGTYSAERGPGTVCSRCNAQHWPETGTYKPVDRAGAGRALELRPDNLPPGNYLLAQLFQDRAEIKLYHPNVGLFGLTAGAAGPPRPTLPNGKAQVVGNRLRGDPFDASKPWTPIGSCLLNLTIAGGPTAEGDRYAITYLVPYSSPTVSGRVSASGKDGSVSGRDSVNPGVVAQRSWDRLLSLSLQADGKVNWSLTSREEQTSTVGGPAGGIGGTTTVLWKCSGVAEPSGFR